jgi:hypothetical protein
MRTDQNPAPNCPGRKPIWNRNSARSLWASGHSRPKIGPGSPAEGPEALVSNLITKVLEICTPNPGRSQKSSTFGVYTVRRGFPTHSKRWGAKPSTMLNGFESRSGLPNPLTSMISGSGLNPGCKSPEPWSEHPSPNAVSHTSVDIFGSII